jgi:hypothetical protein
MLVFADNDDDDDDDNDKPSDALSSVETQCLRRYSWDERNPKNDDNKRQVLTRGKWVLLFSFCSQISVR